MPQDSYRSVLVAGTNGKGSTAALLAAVSTAAGYRTGLFTSPHLEGVEERLRIGGVAIERGELAAVLEEILERGGADGLEPPTYFEALTLAACLWFSRSEVELAVLEVGMGGRLDATNACTPVLSLVAEIGLDHTKPLGNTLREIAREKAGIFRPGTTAISGAGALEARRELERHAHEVGSDLHHVSDLVRGLEVELRRGSSSVAFTTGRRAYALELPLPGEHQVRNLLLAVTAAERLAELGWSDLDRRAIEEGIGRCIWPARLERVELPDGEVVWLDVAHNPQGAASLGRFLAAQVDTYDLLFGVLEDKDARGVLAEIAPAADRVTLTRPPSARALDPESLVDVLGGKPRLAVEPDPSAALDRALDLAREGHRPLVVCGSLYLVGWVRKALRQRFGVPEPATNLVAPSAR